MIVVHAPDVLILAHRGLPGPGRPENTQAAVLAALAAGADGVEVDLRLTADGVLALSHDADLQRLTGLAVSVADTPWQALDAVAARCGVRLSRLEQVVVMAAGRRVVLEVKKPPGGVQTRERTAASVVTRLQSLAGAGVALDVTVSSFCPELLASVRRGLNPDADIRTALLGRPVDRATALLRRAVADGHDEVHPHVLATLARPASVRIAQDWGLAVVPWTVNRPRDVRQLEQLGVDAIITDVPVAARSRLVPSPA